MESREVKFRGWSGCTMYYYKLTGLNKLNDLQLERLLWMQFTGLLDKQGKEIYEGDILKWSQGIGWIIMPVVADEFATGYFPFSRTAQIPRPDNKEVEVIGNIYENPDLLK